MLEKYKYHLLLHIIVFTWGFTGILGKLIHLPALSIVWYRLIIASLALLIYFFWKKKSLAISKGEWWKIALVGFVVMLHWITFYYSIELSTASLGVLCLSTTTLHVSWIEPLVMKRPFSWLEFGLSLIVVLGIFLIAGDFDAKQTKAMYFGLISAFCAAVFPVFNGKLAQQNESVHLTFYELIFGLLFLSVFMAFTGNLNESALFMSWSDFGWLLFLGVICTSVAFLLNIEIIKKLGAYTVSLSINLEPVYTILLAVLILAEHKLLNYKFYIGSVVIVLVILLNAVIKQQLEKRKKLY